MARPGTPLHLHLDSIEQGRVDDGGVAVIHIVLRHLALVDLALFRQEIRAEGLLQEGVALVLFVGENGIILCNLTCTRITRYP